MKAYMDVYIHTYKYTSTSPQREKTSREIFNVQNITAKHTDHAETYRIHTYIHVRIHAYKYKNTHQSYTQSTAIYSLATEIQHNTWNTLTHTYIHT